MCIQIAAEVSTSSQSAKQKAAQNKGKYTVPGTLYEIVGGATHLYYSYTLSDRDHRNEDRHTDGAATTQSN